jgi:hypothetical protein
MPTPTAELKPLDQPQQNPNQTNQQMEKQMNATMITNKKGSFDLLKPLAGVLIGGGLLLGLTGCSTTRQMRQSESDQSGFLGDYSMLQEGKGKEANYLYIDPSANWAGYTKVYIKPIELWHSDDPDSPLGKLSPDSQQMLVDLFNTALANSLAKDFQIVDQPGPGVLVIHGAITEAKKSRPVINLVSSVYLPLKVISVGKRLITGTDIAVGSIQVEAEFTDGETGKRVAAAMDARAGTKALRSKFDGTWGDVKNSFDWWAQRADARLVALKSGDMTTDTL